MSGTERNDSQIRPSGSVIILWSPLAYSRGMLMAYVDHACGHYEQKTFGYPAPWRGE